MYFKSISDSFAKNELKQDRKRFYAESGFTIGTNASQWALIDLYLHTDEGHIGRPATKLNFNKHIKIIVSHIVSPARNCTKCLFYIVNTYFTIILRDMNIIFYEKTFLKNC